MTFKDLQKPVQSQAEAGQSGKNFLGFQDKPLWIFDKEQHRQQYYVNIDILMGFSSLYSIENAA